MLKAQFIADHLLSYENVVINTSLLKGFSVFLNQSSSKEETEQYFAILKNDSYPAVLHLKSEPILIKNLVERFETVSPSTIIDPSHWVQIIASGQIEQEQLFDLIRVAYNNAK